MTELTVNQASKMYGISITKLQAAISQNIIPSRLGSSRNAWIKLNYVNSTDVRKLKEKFDNGLQIETRVVVMSTSKSDFKLTKTEEANSVARREIERRLEEKRLQKELENFDWTKPD